MGVGETPCAGRGGVVGGSDSSRGTGGTLANGRRKAGETKCSLSDSGDDENVGRSMSSS